MLLIPPFHRSGAVSKSRRAPCPPLKVLMLWFWFWFGGMTILAVDPAYEIGPIQSLGDFNSSPAGSNPREALRAEGNIYLIAATPNHQEGLWISDGTPRGTLLLREFLAVESLVQYQNSVFFAAIDADDDHQLWKTDGTPAGTVPVARVSEIYAEIREPVAFDGILYFTARDRQHGQELWRSDGTEAGTHMLRDIFPGERDSAPTPLTPFHDRIFFWADDGTHDRELWSSDGTSEGTTLFQEINVFGDAASPSIPRQTLWPIGDYLYFVADNESNGEQFWMTDGAWGTFPLADTYPDGDDWHTAGESPNPVRLGEEIWFYADGPNFQGKFWTVPTTFGSTAEPAANRLPAEEDDFFPPALIHQDRLFLLGSQGPSGEPPTTLSLWSIDGTPEGHQLVLREARENFFPNLDQAQSLGKWLVFEARDTDHGQEIWTTDGTSESTRPLRDIRPGQNGAQLDFLTRHAESLVFAANDGQHGLEPWITDGTPANTRLLADLFPGTAGSNAFFAPAKSHFFFTAETGDASHPQLFVYDPGTETAIPLTTDLNPIDSLTIDGDNLYFLEGLLDEIHLWRSDGSPAGTEIIATLAIEGHSYLGGMAIHALAPNRLVILTSDVSDSQLWFSDGTPGSATLIMDGLNILASEKGAAGVFLSRDDGTQGYELWVTDGTIAGTQPVSDLLPGPDGSHPSRFLTIGSNTFFLARDADGIQNLWRTDGTAEGTFPLTLFDTELAAPIKQMIPAGDRLLFVVEFVENHDVIWTSDGTFFGTRPTEAVFSPPVGEFQILRLETSQGAIYVLRLEADAEYNLRRAQLWKLTPDLTQLSLLAELPTALFTSAETEFPYETAGLKGHLFFTWSDRQTGQELWHSDGTPAGTGPVTDLYADAFDSAPAALTPFQDRLLFSAITPAYGREPWMLQLVPQNSSIQSPQITRLEYSNGQISFQWQPQDGVRYGVQYTPSLNPPQWNDLPVPPTPGEFEAAANLNSRRFYRLKAEPSSP